MGQGSCNMRQCCSSRQSHLKMCEGKTLPYRSLYGKALTTGLVESSRSLRAALAAPVARHPGPAARGLPPVPRHPVRMGARWADPPSGLPDILSSIPVIIPVRPGMAWAGRGPYDFRLGRRRRTPHIHRRVRRSHRGAQHAREGQRPERTQGTQKLWHKDLQWRAQVALMWRRLTPPPRRVVPPTVRVEQILCHVWIDLLYLVASLLWL